MNIRETFLKLTEYTVPHGTEHLLEPILPEGLQKDKIGNYFIEIGDKSKTMFTCHLDTIGKERVKINHVFEGDIVSTDGKSILGGDNKCGVTILMNLIEHKVPGTYFFFVGEEPPHSCKGSRTAHNSNPDWFRKFDRVIAFDRRGTNSIITRQMANQCCSNEFVNALSREFASLGMHYKADPTGYYTDSAVFMDVIPEVTNISAGVFNEHSTDESVDLAFLEHLANVAVNIDWEKLPVARKPRTKKTKKGKNKKDQNLAISKKTFIDFSKLMDNLNYICIDCDDNNDFDPDEEYTFSHWHKEIEHNVKFNGKKIILNGVEFNDLLDFKLKAGLKLEHYVVIEQLFVDVYNYALAHNDIIRLKEMEKILSDYVADPSELNVFLEENSNYGNYLWFEKDKGYYRIKK